MNLIFVPLPSFVCITSIICLCFPLSVDKGRIGKRQGKRQNEGILVYTFYSYICGNNSSIKSNLWEPIFGVHTHTHSGEPHNNQLLSSGQLLSLAMYLAINNVVAFCVCFINQIPIKGQKERESRSTNS